MTRKTTTPEAAAQEAERAAVIGLLGGPRSLGSTTDSLDLHDRLARGLPRRALKHFTSRCPRLAQDPALTRVLGLVPTPRNARGARQPRRLSRHQSNQLFRLAVVVAQATPLLGGIEAADDWLLRPALGLGGRRPLDLLATPVGAALVADHLVQLDFGVYV